MQNQIPPSQIVLAIDTSGPRLQLALHHAGNTDVLVEDLPKGHAEIIFDRIAILLARNSMNYESLTRVAVTTGPGSFTGLRIGLSAARGLGLGLGVAVIGVPTLIAMSLAIHRAGQFTILVDARRGEAYAQQFSDPAIPIANAQLVPFDGNARQFEIVSDKVDIDALAHFAASAKQADYPPIPTYLRSADAKPQTKGIVAHARATP